jgi:hypothetical protein
MTTVPDTTPPRKCFYAGLYNGEQHGILTMDDQGAVWFREHGTSQLTLITPELYAHLDVRGEVGLAELQRMRDGDRVLKCSKTLLPRAA